MKRVLYSVCIGSLALALTAGAAQDNKKKAERARPQHRTANVHAARPANTGAMTRARHSATVDRPPIHRASRSNSTAAMNQNRTRAVRERSNAAVNRDRNFAVTRTRNDVTRHRNTNESRARSNVTVNRERNLAVNRTRNANINRTRNSVAVNRERNRTVNRTRNAEVNRARNANEFRGRNNVAINRNRNFAVNRTGNAAYYRGGNVRVTNNWRGDAFRGQRYAAFRNYNRQWHNRSWWRSHYDRIIFVNSGWYYWNAGYWFPAWGYAPSVSYVYDGPIYAYNGWTPDRVTVNVQEQLARAGYYDGPIDGVLGPMTREAIAAFQADNGLAVTSAIDEPTLATLGIA
jgi:hypothetical protein